MGNTSSSSGGHKLLINHKEPLSFHGVHSEHIRLFNDCKVARRVESFCKGICFSARPVSIGEHVSIRCSDISTNWSGFLRVGFTSHNPSTLVPSALPRYACPDMTNLPGNWAKALPERFGIVNNVITYFVTRTGEVFIALNGEDLPGPFFSGVNVSIPLWALIDIYGNATGVEFLDRSLSPLAMVSASSDAAAVPRRRKTTTGNPSPAASIPVTSPSRHNAKLQFAQLQFHTNTGVYVNINPERNVATRHVAEYANAYVFTERPVNIGEKIVIQVLGIDPSYTGGLTVGMTACDPATLTTKDFPDDSDKLLDRLEYWVVHKDVVSSAEVGDELSLSISNDGEVQFSRNAHSQVVIMHIDKTIPMWLFWDLYGQFSQIKLFGAVAAAKPKSRTAPQPPPSLAVRLPQQARSQSLTDPPQSAPATQAAASLTVALPPIQNLSLVGAPPIPPRLQRANSAAEATGAVSPNSTDRMTNSAILASPVQEVDEASQNMANECTVCFENPCDCVIYTCGHMCMCFDCATQVKSSSDPLCPICRQNIKDVIRIYKS